MQALDGVLSQNCSILASKKIKILKLEMFIELLEAQPTLNFKLKMNNLRCSVK